MRVTIWRCLSPICAYRKMGQSGVQTQTRGEVSRGPTGARRGFALLSPQFLDELRGRVMLSNLVGRTVPLKKAGNEYKACCPFHQEKTPSFWVNDQKGFYHLLRLQCPW